MHLPLVLAHNLENFWGEIQNWCPYKEGRERLGPLQICWEQILLNLMQENLHTRLVLYDNKMSRSPRPSTRILKFI